MAKGQIAKEAIINKILETFEGSFKYDKEVRIPFNENGEPVQIKVTFTCAKTNVAAGGDNAIPTGTAPVFAEGATDITKEEKEEVEELLERLHL